MHTNAAGGAGNYIIAVPVIVVKAHGAHAANVWVGETVRVRCGRSVLGDRKRVSERERERERVSE